jgi:negative regulator of flagellin synthesis FlgM
MSNSIQPFSQPSVPDTQAGATSVPAAASAPAAAQPEAQTDSVTLSQAAQSGAALFAAAQNSTGIDQNAVANIRAKLADGSYDVSPENLAQAIATVLKETK